MAQGEEPNMGQGTAGAKDHGENWQDLEAQLTTISLRYPGYQEYRMDLDDIGHDPYQLISYLTTYHWNFHYEDVENFP